MSTSMVLGLFDWIGDFFKSLFDLIPKIMYLLYASMACVLDVLQLFFRKLAGLDVYYVDGKAIQGDIVTNFITGILGINKDNLTYSALSTVFWSMVVFGVIICFACTIFAIIKSHYNYDEKAAKGPMQYVYTAGKAILNMVVVPIVVVLGLYVSEALLTAVDTITSTNSGTVEALYGTDTVNTYLCKTDTRTGKSTMIYYDIFGVHSGVVYGLGGGQVNNEKGKFALIAAASQPFSGSLFKVAAYNGNRARLGQMDPTKGGYTGAAGSNLPLFVKAGNDKDVLADMIDTAFACNLHAKEWFDLDYTFGSIVSFRYFTNYLTIGANSFSKFNVGLVWYYYDLWQFNFIVGFAGIIVCLSIFINIILGLITRLFMCIVLFLVAPPLFGLAPLDGGKAGKGWRENFMKQALMAYGAVVGMNLVLMILPYMNEIDFFNIPIADYFAQTLVIIVGLITIKAVIATLSGLIGAADANETGGKIKDEVADVAGKATKMTVGAAKIGGKIGGKVGLAVGSDLMKGAGKLGGLVGKIGFKERDASGNVVTGPDGKPIRHTLGGLAHGIAKGTKTGAVGLKNFVVGKDKDHRTGLGAFVLGGKTKSGKEMAGLGRGKASQWIEKHTAVGGLIKQGKQALGASVKDKLYGKVLTDDEGNAKLDKNGRALRAGGLFGKQSVKDGAIEMKNGKEVTKGGLLNGVKNLTVGGNPVLNLAGSLRLSSENVHIATQRGANGEVKKAGVGSDAMSLFHDGLLKPDSGLGKFLDSSEIKKKPDHDKATAENTAAMLKSSQEQKQEMAEMTKAIKELTSKLGPKP